MSAAPTVTTLDSPADLRAFLGAVGTVGPSLHPHVDSDDPWKRWNGWNYTATTGVCADGRPFMAYLSHYASGRSDIAAGGVPGTPHGLLQDDDLTRWARAGVVFPVHVLPATSVVLHPEHTPVRP